MGMAIEDRVLTMPEIRKPLQAIKAKCLDCSCGSREEVRLCPCKTCALYAFRHGKNPFMKGNINSHPSAAFLAHKKVRKAG